MLQECDELLTDGMDFRADAPTTADINQLLEAASGRFSELFQGLPVACFCFDTEGRLLEWNRSSEALFRRRPSDVLQQSAWEVVGRVEDWEITRALVRSVLAGATYDNLEWEHRFPDGRVRHLLGNVFPLRERGGGVVGGISANVDISERKQTERALHESEERWHLALQGTNDGIWDWNIRAGEAFYSTRWKQMLGHDEDEIGSSRTEWSQRVHSDDSPGVLAALHAHLDGKTEFYSAEYRLRCKNGAYKWVLDRGQALWNRNQEALRIAGSVTDITERKRYEQQLQEANARLETLATEDGLTGLKNHRAFQERFETEFARAPRYHTPLSLILADVDKFKEYNDEFGHQTGDAVLRQVADLLKSSVRETDLVARYGGEEFVVILPHTDLEGARAVAERCREAIGSTRWPKRPVTASFGVATTHPSFQSREQMVAAADKALYASKAAGRNRVIHTQDTLHGRP